MKALTTTQAITGFNLIHGNKYEYSLVDYSSAKVKVRITCRLHGVFEQTPDSHKNGHGCPKCSPSALKNTAMYKKELEHGGSEYSILGKYEGALIKVLHKHKLCGNTWSVAPNTLLQGSGCPLCNTKDTSKFIEKSLDTHGNLYEYSLVHYLQNHIKVEILCKKHGSFWQTPASHSQGSGCPKCAKTGFKKDKPAILYYLSVKNGEAYKIGITNHSVKQRYSNEELQDIEIIEEWGFKDGQEAYNLEQIILKSYKHLKYTGKDLLKSGNTELFKEDIFKGKTWKN